MFLILKETFRAAAEANENDILKLFNSKGHMISISIKSLESNSDSNPYRLEVIGKVITG